MRNNTRVGRTQKRSKDRKSGGAGVVSQQYGAGLVLAILTSLEWEARRVNPHRDNLPARIKSLLRTRSYTELKALSIPDPMRYESSTAFAIDYQAYSLVRKADAAMLDTGIDRRSAALTGYLNMQAHCKAVSVSLYGHVSPLIEDIRQTIASIIGDYPVADDWLPHCTFTNGATATTSRSDGLGRKLTGCIAVTRACLPYLRAAMSTDYIWLRAQLYGWDTASREPLECVNRYSSDFPSILSGPLSLLDSEFEVIEEEVWDSVPKTAFTDRSIGKQPVGNVYVQKGIDAYLRQKLLKEGIDLSDQSTNQNWAWLGSAFGKYATLDLSNASDSISVGLIKCLLPERWYALLNAVRCKFSQLPDGSVIPCELFSSMGNAFTFSLETIVFYAISKVACKHRFKPVVYGDDIIVPVVYYADCISILKFLGMEVNRNKSFAAGPFRESCGAHFWRGFDVKPFYLKRRPDVFEQETARVVNQLRSWCTRVGLWSGIYDQCADPSGDSCGRSPSAVELTIALMTGDVDSVCYRSSEDLWAILCSALLMPGCLLDKPVRALVPYSENNYEDGSVEGLEVPDPPRRWNNVYQTWQYRKWVRYTPSRSDPIGYAWGALTGAGAKCLPLLNGRHYIVSYNDAMYAISDLEVLAGMQGLQLTQSRVGASKSEPYLLAHADPEASTAFGLRYS